MNLIKILNEIKQRYFRPVIARKEGILTHFGMCDVYRAVEVYETAPCTCGLNLDLHCLGRYSLIEKLNPNFSKEEAQKEVNRGGPIDQEEVAKVFEAFGIKFNEVEKPDTEAEDREDWQMIGEVFGQDYVEYLQKKRER